MFDRIKNLFTKNLKLRKQQPKLKWWSQELEVLEERSLLTASPLPVLMVISDNSDFYFQEYGDTRASLEANGLAIQVAASTTQPSTPHANSGQGDSSGVVTPDIALSDVNAANYSSIVFVGGWGSSMYQYAFSGDYSNDLYDGNQETKSIVNDLINDFIEQDKYVTAICHAVTVLAWARVDGVSPIDGKTVSVPWIGGPAVYYQNEYYPYFAMSAYQQVVENGATANTISGQFGTSPTAEDDVIVDGRIITAENYDSASMFGQVVAQSILASTVNVPENQPPVIQADDFAISETTLEGAVVGQISATDPDAGQTLSYAIVGGNEAGIFAIDPVTGAISVVNAALLNYESQAEYQLSVRVSDDGEPSLSATEVVTIELLDAGNPSESPLPVLVVIADLAHFYYQEYADTRAALESEGLSVQVAASTLRPSTPHENSGQGVSSGIVTPDITLTDAEAVDYSAIVFVGGWGASMYQYAFSGNYSDDLYDGDLATRTTVNDLIGEFVAQEKYVTAICHAVTVLAWARVDGVSPIEGRTVSVPVGGGPAVFYQNTYYPYFAMSAYQQVTENGATANTISGEFGASPTAEDDVVVDGRIITAENYDSATLFGYTIAQAILNDFSELPDVPDVPVPPANTAPILSNGDFLVPENVAVGTIVGQVQASDFDAGQTLTYEIIGGNELGVFELDSQSGEIRVANSNLLDFESQNQFQLLIRVTDNGESALSTDGAMTIQVTDVAETPPSPISWVGSDVHIAGTSGNDVIYVWTGDQGHAELWMNGTFYDPFLLPWGSRIVVSAGDGNDAIFAYAMVTPVTVHGGAGDDLIHGGTSHDALFGESGNDEIRGNNGNDLLDGGSGNDRLFGEVGNDAILGGDGSDQLDGSWGQDLLIGGLGYDQLNGGECDDLLIGGTTTFDNNFGALQQVMSEWGKTTSMADRLNNLTNGVGSGIRLRKSVEVQDDGIIDCLYGGNGADALFASGLDYLNANSPCDILV